VKKPTLVFPDKDGSQVKAYIKTITMSKGTKKIDWTALLNTCEFNAGGYGVDDARMGDVSMADVNRASLSHDGFQSGCNLNIDIYKKFCPSTAYSPLSIVLVTSPSSFWI
jgi:hypothetical protein